MSQEAQSEILRRSDDESRRPRSVGLGSMWLDWRTSYTVPICSPANLEKPLKRANRTQRIAHRPMTDLPTWVYSTGYEVIPTRSIQEPE